MNIRDSIYSAVADQFPAVYRDEGDFLVSFIEAYYQHNDAVMDRDVPKLRDIDTTITKFLIYYKKKYLTDLPLDGSVDVRYIIKHIRDMYNRKGTQESLELLFRLFFDEEIEVFYPSTAVLRPSDSIWGGDAYLEMLPIFTVDGYPIKKGDRIRGDISLSSAFVDEVIFVNFGGSLSPIIYISNVAGSFTSDDSIVIATLDSSGNEFLSNVGKLISGSMSSVLIEPNNRRAGQSVGDRVKVVSALSGVEGEARVVDTSTTTTGTISFDIEDGGFGYVEPNSLTATNTLGISNQVLIVKSSTPIDLKAGDELYAAGEEITHSNADIPFNYSLSGSAKVISYKHPLVFVQSTSAKDVILKDTQFNDTEGLDRVSFFEQMMYEAAGATTDVDAPWIEEAYPGARNKAFSEGKYDTKDAYNIAGANSGEGIASLSRHGKYVESSLGKALWFNPSLLVESGHETQARVDIHSNLLLAQNSTWFNQLTPILGTEILPGISPYFKSDAYTGPVPEWYETLYRLYGYYSIIDVYPKLTVSVEYAGGQTYGDLGYTDSGDPDLSTYPNQPTEVSGYDGPNLNPIYNPPSAIQNSAGINRVDGLPYVLPSDLTNTTARLKVWRKGRKIATAPYIEISTLGTVNAGANFEVSSISNIETVSLITDQVGDFSNVVLDLAGPDDYGMSGPGAEDLNTTLADAFTSITVKIGSIESLTTLSEGSNYQNDVAASITHENITKFDKRDVIVTFDEVSFNIDAGTIISQNIVIPGVEINQSGNIDEDEIEGMGATTTGPGYQTSSTNFEFTSGNNIDYVAKARFLKRIGNDFYFRPQSFYGLQTGTGVMIGGSSRTPVTVLQDADSLPMGGNARIIGRASFESGRVEEVVVTNTGYKYTDLEPVDLISLDQTSEYYNTVIAKGSVRVLGQGKTQGRWESNTSFLSDSSKKLHDNDYYQEYSYDISSIVDPKSYGNLIGETVGVAGTKLFSTPLINSISNLESDLEVEFNFYDITSKQMVTYDGNNYVTTVSGADGDNLHADTITEIEGPV